LITVSYYLWPAPLVAMNETCPQVGMGEDAAVCDDGRGQP